MFSWKKLGIILLIIAIIMVLIVAFKVFFFSTNDTVVGETQQTNITTID